MLDQVRELTPTLRALGPRIDAEAAVPAEVIARLTELGVFRLAAPAALGGLESPPERMAEIFEELGRADAATGWCAVVSGGAAYAASSMPSKPYCSRAMLRSARMRLTAQ